MARTRTRRRSRRSESLGTFVATAYGPPWNSMNGTGVTSTGVDLKDGVRRYLVAVDPSVIPYGTLVRIQPNPYGTTRPFVAADTGGAIRGKRIDFYVAEGRDQQLGFGRRNVRVTLAGKAKAGDPATLKRAATGGLTEAVATLTGLNPLPIGPDIGPDLPGPEDLIPGGGGIPSPGDIIGGVGDIAKVLERVAQFFVGLGELLLTPEGWVRIGKLLLGVIALTAGANKLMQIATGTSAFGALGKVTFGAALAGKKGAVGALIGGAGGSGAGSAPSPPPTPPSG